MTTPLLRKGDEKIKGKIKGKRLRNYRCKTTNRGSAEKSLKLFVPLFSQEKREKNLLAEEHHLKTPQLQERKVVTAPEGRVKGGGNSQKEDRSISKDTCITSVRKTKCLRPRKK